jgi:hypothetical protein
LLGHFGHSFQIWHPIWSIWINLNQFDIFGILNSNTTLSGNLVLCRPLDSSLDSVQHPMDLLMLEMGANINIINSASINSLGWLSGVTPKIVINHDKSLIFKTVTTYYWWTRTSLL